MSRLIELSAAERIMKKPELEQGVKSYMHLMQRLHKCDVSNDKEFQQRYTIFYQMKRFSSDRFLSAYFMCLEQLKCQSDLSFDLAFEQIYKIESRMELSFCSKLVHTINPQKPIWDKIVTTDHFHFKRPYSNCKNPIDKCISRYNEYEKAFSEYMESEEGKQLISIFDDRFLHSGISNAKKIDFILWQDRA